jgi:stage II sporulation SpoAA-like protein
VITYQTEPGSPVIEIHVTGHVTNHDFESAMASMPGDLESGGKTRILEVIEQFTGIDPSALWTDIKVGIPLAGKVTHIAIVADQSWVRAIAHLGRLFTRAEIRIFEPRELDEARRWIAA